jgi:TonB family protein
MRMKLCLALVALSMFGASGAFGQDAAATTDAAKGSGSSAAPQATPAEKPKRIRIAGNVTSAKITHMVQPVYPQAAKSAGVSGTVVLHCIIAKDGTVSQVEYVSGPPLLIKSAMDAVRQWTYQPTKLNREPIEVDTTISVVFQLGKKSAAVDKQDDAGAIQGDSTAGPSEASTEPYEPAPIDAQLGADIRHLMDVTHFKEKQYASMKINFEPMRPALMASFPDTPNREKIVDTYMDHLLCLLQNENFTNAMTGLFARYLTDDDVRAASAFYETPAGQHYLQSSQNLVPEVMAIGRRIGSQSIPSILKDLCIQYPELEGQANFCGPVQPPKTSLLPGDPPPAGN